MEERIIPENEDLDVERGFKVVDRKFSEEESLPTFMLANINPGNDIQYNLGRFHEIVRAAHNRGVNILIMPELAISGYVYPSEDKDEVRNHFRSSDNLVIKKDLDEIVDSFTEDGSGLEIVLLNNVRVSGESLYDTTFVLNKNLDYNHPDNVYDKMFLTPIEKEYFVRGSDKRLVVDTRWGRLGVLICYDICFVGLPKKYAFYDKVDAVITQAAWRKESVREYENLNFRMDNYYEYIWSLKNDSMSSYNQVWSIAANCVGAFEGSGASFCGGSGFWSPSGIPLLQASAVKEELLIMRNLDIKGHLRNQAREDFDYSVDFDEVYREVRDLTPNRITV